MILASIQDEPAFGFMVIALVIIFAPLVAQKVGLPGLIGLLLGGALIGPNVLGVLGDAAGLRAFGDLGVLYLLFLAGLGLDMKTFYRARKVAITFGLITSAIPWILGTVVARYYGYDIKAAILIGSFWASFTLVSYGAVTKYRLTRNASMAATVGASSITDTIGLVALALIVGSESDGASGIVLLLRIGGGLILLAAYCLLALPFVTRWFYRGLGQERELRFMMLLAGFASAAVLAELLGIEGLIGAFFAGLGLNRLVPNRSPLMARTDFFGNAFFIPTFLVSVGLLVDPAVMFQWTTMRIAIGLALALVVGKAAAAWITGHIFDFSFAEIGLVFSLSTAQAAATLASTIIGFEIGLYGPEIVNAVMIVVVISLFISAVGSGYFAPRVEPARSLDRRVGETIVVPVDVRAKVAETFWLAGQIAEPDSGLVLPMLVANTEAELRTLRAGEFLKAKEHFSRLGLDGDVELRLAHSIASAVNRIAVERDASLVMLSWPGHRDFRGVMLGGSNDEIAATTDRPIAVAALSGKRPIRVLLYVDESDLQPGPLVDVRMALRLARRVCESSKILLAVGPASIESLSDAGLTVPEETIRIAGSDKSASWLEKSIDAVPLTSTAKQSGWIGDHAEETDLVILPAPTDPFALLQIVYSDGLSMLAVTTHQESQYYSSEGALGVTLPR